MTLPASFFPAWILLDIISIEQVKVATVEVFRVQLSIFFLVRQLEHKDDTTLSGVGDD